MDAPPDPAGGRPSRPGGLAFLIEQWRAAPPARHPRFQAPNPYPGLRSFTPDENLQFKGRGPQVERLRGKLASQNVMIVVGGSGSGKSSVVRAGLLPNLHAFGGIPGRSGRWYAAEFAPGTDPGAALAQGLSAMLARRLLRPDRPQFAVALAEALGLDAPPADAAALQAALAARLAPGGLIDAGALIDFASTTLEALDRALFTLTDAPPQLMLLVDQFEEVFRVRSPEQARALTDLVVSVHDHRPAPALFLALTMRSEELHRCTEFPGLAEVVNTSAYLLDRMDRAALEEALVQPARDVLSQYRVAGWDREDPAAPYERVVLDRLLDAASSMLGGLEGSVGAPASETEAGAHRADAIPLLQHGLRRLWDAALARWSGLVAAEESDAASRTLSITEGDLAAAHLDPAAAGGLRGCLNVWADATLAEAKLDLEPERPESQAEDVLAIAFDAFASTDDNAKWVRNFRTVPEIAGLAGVAPEGGLAVALGRFEAAGYLQRRGDHLTVSHEAFFRSWTRFLAWMTRCREVSEALAEADKNIVEATANGTWPARQRLDMAARFREWAWGRRAEVAGTALRRKISDALDAIFATPTLAEAPKGAAAVIAAAVDAATGSERTRHRDRALAVPRRLTRAWASDRLARRPGAAEAAHVAGLGEREWAQQRLDELRRGWKLATRWHVYGRRRGHFVLGSLALSVGSILVFSMVQWWVQGETARVERAAKDMLTIGAVAADLRADDRRDTQIAAWELGAVLAAVRDFGTRLPDHSRELQDTWSRVDAAARRLLGGTVTIAVEPPPDGLTSARCTRTGEVLQAHLIDGTPVRFFTDPAAAGTDTATVPWVFEVAPAEAGEGVGRLPSGGAVPLPKGNWVCLSPDASMLLVWQQEAQVPPSGAAQSPLEQIPIPFRLAWACTSSTGGLCSQWTVRPAVFQSVAMGLPQLRDHDGLASMLVAARGRLATAEEPEIGYFYAADGDREGLSGFFLEGGAAAGAGSGGGEGVVLQVFSGVVEPEPMPPPSGVAFQPLDVIGLPGPSTGNAPAERPGAPACSTGTVDYSGKRFLLCLSRLPPSPGSPGRILLSLRFAGDENPDAARIAVTSYESAELAGIAEDADYLWLQDVHGQVRRLAVGQQQFLGYAAAAGREPAPDETEFVLRSCRPDACRRWLAGEMRE